MDRETIRKELHNLTQEEVPKVNLLPEIQEQLTKQARRRPRILFQMARTAVAAVILMMASVAGYTFVLQNMLQSPAIPEDLIISIDQTQTIQEMTARLEWAYADEHRMAVQVATRYDAAITAQGNLQSFTLETTDGIVIPSAFGGGGGGGGDHASSIVEGAFMSSFDMRGLDFDTNTLDLVLTLNYGYDPNAMMPSMGGSGGGGGGSTGAPPASGSGGGGGGSTGAPSATVPDEAAPDRTFVFEFSVPLYPAREGEISNTTQMLDDTSVTVSDVRVSPSMTIFNLCSAYFEDGWFARIFLKTDEPLPEYIDNARTTVLLDGEQVYAGGAFQMTPIEGQTTCREMVIPAPFTEDGQQMTLIVDEFFRPVMEKTVADIEADVAYFAGKGFDITYELVALPYMGTDPSVQVIPISQDTLMVFTLDDYPETMSASQAQQYVAVRILNERVESNLSYEIGIE